MYILIHMHVHIYIHICPSGSRIIYLFSIYSQKNRTHWSTKRDFNNQNRYSLMDCCFFRQDLHLFSISCDRGDGFLHRENICVMADCGLGGGLGCFPACWCWCLLWNCWTGRSRIEPQRWAATVVYTIPNCVLSRCNKRGVASQTTAYIMC